MNIRRIAAWLFAALAACVAAFQLALTLGAPWGEYAMGGAVSGPLPPALRAAALVQALLWVVFTCVVLSRAGIALPRWARASRWMAWGVVAVMAISTVLNVLTPSAGERMIWAPVALTLLVCSVLVATGPAPAGR